MNSDFLRAFLFILLLDSFFFLAQQGAISVSADIGENVSFFDYNSSMIKSVDTGGYALSSNYSNELPSVTQSVSTDNSVQSYLTERWNSLRSWVLDSTPAGYVYKIVNAFPRFLVFMGTPDYLVFTLGALWHLFTIVMIILLFTG